MAENMGATYLELMGGGGGVGGLHSERGTVQGKKFLSYHHFTETNNLM